MTSAEERPDHVALLDREARSLVLRLRVWTPQRWAAASPVGASRAEVAHHLAQALADLEGAAPVPVPRLDNDLALPDQVAVTAADLVASGPTDETARAATAHLLLHRDDLLADPLPAGLVSALQLDGSDPLAEARTACPLHP